MGSATPTIMKAYDFAALLAQMKQEEVWQRRSYHTVTVREGQGLRVALFALHAGAVIPPHQVEGPMTAQVLEGRLKFSVGSESVILAPGHLVTLPAGVQHHLEALEDTVFLLTRITG